MFKFGQKSISKEEEQEQLMIENALKNRDSWVKNYFIVVPNNVTPKDLTKYQKLIVLRKPDGEQRVVVDFSLTDEETQRLHFESLNSDTIDLKDKNTFRIIPTNLNTKEVEDSHSIREDEIEHVSKILVQSAEEFRKHEIEQESEITFLRMNDKNVKVINDRFFNSDSSNFYDKDVDDIDSVVIETEESVKLRETWKNVDDFIMEENEIERRKMSSYDEQENHEELPKDYCPNIQPLFRNFIDLDFFNIDNNVEENEITFDDSKINEYPKYDVDISVDEEVEDKHKLNPSREIGVELYNFDDDIETEQENPEILVSNLDEPKKMGDYLSQQQQHLNESVETQQEQENTVVSFFKNNVTPNPINTNMGHIPKHIKFYKTTRNVRYEKVILNKKKKMYTYRKVLVD